MIEFKAECGHTVRAKDEDAGNLVRCSYCGKPTTVPENAGNGLDFLFSDIQQPPEEAKRKRRKRAKEPRQRRPGEFDPFAVILRLCYAALLIIIVVVVGRKFVIPIFKGEGFRQRLSTIKVPGKEEPREDTRRERGAEPEKPGLLVRDKLIGLYVESTPPGAAVYCISASKAPPSGRIHKVSGVLRFQAGQPQNRLPDGEYVAEVEFPWNDPKLTPYRDYLQFRVALRNASAEQRQDLLDDYFIPDDGDFFVDETPEQIYLVRQYRDVDVHNRQSKGVRALFLPKITHVEGDGFSIEELVTHYIPDERAYAFDRKYVQGELVFNGVRKTDLSFVLEALSRIGVIPYVTPDRRLLLFKIDMHDGSFAVRTLRDRYK